MNPQIRTHRCTPQGRCLLLLAALLLALPGAPLAGSNQEAPAAGAAGGPKSEGRRTTAPPAADSSAAAIQGSWLVEILEEPQGRVKSEPGPMRFVIDDTTIVMRRGRQLVAETRYALDAGQTPATIKFSFGGEPAHGVCQRSGDWLMICLARANEPLPKKFELGPEGGRLLLILRGANEKVRPIWVMDIDGKNLHPLVSMPEYTAAGSPRWSRDGKRFAFDACRPGFEEVFSPHSHVFVANADGSGIRDVGDGAMPSWSGDGMRIAISRYGGNRGIWIMNADGSHAELIDERGWGAAWSPAAPRVAYAVYDDGIPNIRVRELDRPRERTLLTRRYASLHYSFCWSPDGQWIALRGTTRDGQRQFAAVHVEGEAKGFKVLWPARFEGPSSSPPLEGPEQFCGTVAWTGDGRRLLSAIFAPDGLSCRLYFLDVAQQRPPELLRGQPTGWRLWGIDLSPDGKKILFNGIVPPSRPEWDSLKLSGPELLSNPSFDTDDRHWYVWTGPTASATGVRDAAVHDSAPAGYRVNCKVSGPAGPQLQLMTTSVSVVADQWYRLSFRAKCTHPFTMPSVVLDKPSAPWNPYAVSHFKPLALTTEWADYEVFFQATSTAADARLAFRLGGVLPTGSRFYIDTLSLRRCQAPDRWTLPIVDVGNRPKG